MEQQFDTLYHEHRRLVEAICHRILKNRKDAEDAAAETWGKVARNLHKYDPRQPFEPWVVTIARRTALDRWRRRNTREAREVSEEELPSWSELHAGDVIDAERVVVGRAEWGRAYPLVMQLPETQRIVWVLAEVEEKSDPEISVELGLGVGTVRNAKSAAKLRLQVWCRIRLRGESREQIISAMAEQYQPEDPAAFVNKIDAAIAAYELLE